jgi:hypothetical protein
VGRGLEKGFFALLELQEAKKVYRGNVGYSLDF